MRRVACRRKMSPLRRARRPAFGCRVLFRFTILRTCSLSSGRITLEHGSHHVGHALIHRPAPASTAFPWLRLPAAPPPRRAAGLSLRGFEQSPRSARQDAAPPARGPRRSHRPRRPRRPRWLSRPWRSRRRSARSCTRRRSRRRRDSRALLACRRVAGAAPRRTARATRAHLVERGLGLALGSGPGVGVGVRFGLRFGLGLGLE